MHVFDNNTSSVPAKNLDLLNNPTHTVGWSQVPEADLTKGVQHADVLCRIREGKRPPIMTIGHVFYRGPV